jgi:hypothetical protein
LHKRFREGHKNVEDEKCSSHPRSHRTNENEEKVQNLVHSDRCLSIRTMVVHVNLEKGTVMCVIKDLNFGPTNIPLIWFHDFWLFLKIKCALKG